MSTQDILLIIAAIAATLLPAVTLAVVTIINAVNKNTAEVAKGNEQTAIADTKKIEISEQIAAGTGSGATTVVNTAPTPPSVEVVPAPLTEDTGRALVRAIEELAASQRPTGMRGE